MALAAYHCRVALSDNLSSSASWWYQGICASTSCTNVSSGQASAKARIELELVGRLVALGIKQDEAQDIYATGMRGRSVRRSDHATKRYHRALMLRHPELVEVIQGFHILGPSSLPRYVPGQPPNKADLHQVWMIEEKQTDVNLALHIYRDAMRSQCEQLVICSNDSDLEPALQMVRSDAPDIAIGLVMPLRETAKEEGVYSNKRLTALADWVRHHIIRDEELATSQLPTHVPSRKKPVSKPSHW